MTKALRRDAARLLKLRQDLSTAETLFAVHLDRVLKRHSARDLAMQISFSEVILSQVRRGHRSASIQLLERLVKAK
jgi:hypothetical protein